MLNRDEILRLMAKPLPHIKPLGGLNITQPMDKLPMFINPIKMPTPSLNKSFLRELSDGLENMILGLLKLVAPSAYRERHIARTFPAWGRRHRQLRVLALPVPKMCAMCKRHPRESDYYCRDCFEVLYCEGMESDE